VRLLKKFNVHFGQKVPFVLACFQVSVPPRLENPDSDEKDALFGIDTQITINGLGQHIVCIQGDLRGIMSPTE
jgi:hypothetical protein